MSMDFVFAESPLKKKQQQQHSRINVLEEKKIGGR